MITVEGFTAKYLGKKVGTGASVCFRFVKEFYQEELGIEIVNDYMEMLNEFTVTKDPRFGDIVVMRVHPIVTNHLGIFLKPGYFAHCGAGIGLDEIIISSPDDPVWRSKIVGYLRHKGQR